LQKNLAEEQALMGLDLAYQANDAHTSANEIAVARQVALDEGQDRDDWYKNVMLPQEGALTETRVHQVRHQAYADAAGALIGRYTLGGEHLSVQNGNDPVLSSDGSHKSGSAN
jgi:hypothetical protein